MDKNQLLDAFQSYLEQAEDSFGEDAQETDLYSLFTEMAALRNEVKTESRHFKSALDDFKTVINSLQSSHDTLSQNLEQRVAEQNKQHQQIQRNMLMDMLDMYDRLDAGLNALKNYTPGFWGGKQQKTFIEGVREGQSMSLRRVVQNLTRYGVQPIEALGKKLDPHIMRAEETTTDPDYENGCVVEELRKGFLWNGDVLRLAEVKVNKL